MPRIPRGQTQGGIYHIVNRGNMRMQVFDDEDDYEFFLKLLKTGLERDNIELHAYCLMPNHFHLLLVPQGENSLSKFMQWVMTSHVRYYHKKNKTSGHIWQGRFKSFIVEKDSYYLTLMRYIEANALRADLSKTAQDWQYGSLSERVFRNRKILNKPYGELDNWVEYVNTPQTQKEIDKIRNSINRQAPLGNENWVIKMAKKHGLLSTLKARGRPKNKKKL